MLCTMIIVPSGGQPGQTKSLKAKYICLFVQLQIIYSGRRQNILGILSGTGHEHGPKNVFVCKMKKKDKQKCRKRTRSTTQLFIAL